MTSFLSRHIIFGLSYPHLPCPMLATGSWLWKSFLKTNYYKKSLTKRNERWWLQKIKRKIFLKNCLKRKRKRTYLNGITDLNDHVVHFGLINPVYYITQSFWWPYFAFQKVPPPNSFAESTSLFCLMPRRIISVNLTSFAHFQFLVAL